MTKPVGSLLERVRGGTATLAPTLRPHAPDSRRLASAAQQRLWFLSRFEGDAATYAVPLAFHVRGELSVERLDRALTTIVKRHEVLRTALVERDGTLWQEPAPATAFSTRQLKASGLAAALEAARVEARVPFALDAPPLLRSTCFRMGPQDALLVLVFHHVVCDAWSLGVFFSELRAVYAAATAGDAAPPLPDLAAQYGDYAEWQREWLKGPQAQAQRAYWREQLAGVLPQMQLGRSRPAASARSYAGAVESFRWDKELAAQIEALAQKHRATVFTVLLSGFQALLRRYSLQDDLIIGVPVACRSLPETDGLIGFFTNTLAWRADFSTRQRFSTFLNRNAEQMLGALSHQELPFDQVVDEIKLTREAAQNPVFQAMFVMQNTTVDSTMQLPGLAVESVPLHSGTAKVDITCSMKYCPSGLEGEIEYSTESFDAVWARRLVSCFKNLLTDAARRPDAWLDELALFSPDEAAARINAARAGVETYPSEETIHGLFEAQARRTPAAAAIEIGGRVISYAELNERANRLAWRLKAAGAQPETLIGVCLDRSAELVVALLATLKCGAAFVPLDVGFPGERIRQICADAAPLLILTRERYRQTLADVGVPLLAFDAAEEAGPAVDPRVAVAGSNVAYVYYTSGSTGVPKGVTLEHGCAMNRLQWLRRSYPLGRGEGVLHKTPLIFDVSIWEIFLPLFVGATIVMADPGAEADPAHLSALLRTKRIVLAHFVPSMLATYLNHVAPAEYPALKWVALSGEAVPANLPEHFAAHFRAELHNQYGQSETSEVAVWEGGERAPNGSVPIGRQVGVYRLYVLDAGLGPVPPSVPGELCVAGLDGLARGYHKRPDLTAERFVPNPYAVVPGERLYRTGDLARMDEGGGIEYLGRADQQTKIRGCRVETGEVETALARHPDVRGCVVVARPDEDGANHLIAYVLGDAQSAAALGAHAEQSLPRFMLPAAYVFLDEFPRTPSDKVDRARLPAPCAADFAARSQKQEAQTSLEAEICALWREVLRLPDVGRTDNFFNLGGNSLKSVSVLSKIKQTFGVEVSVSDFFLAPTVAGLAAAVERALEQYVSSLSEAEAAQLLGEEAE